MKRQWGIISASMLAALLIGGAYLLAAGAFAPRQAGATDTTALLQAVATRDSNGDGLPDWEKVLYGIPINATTTDYFHLGMTDGEAVARGLIVPKAVVNIPTPPAATSSETLAALGLPSPSPSGTLTSAFAKNFFLLYLTAKQANGGAALSQTQEEAVAQQALTQLSQAVSAVPNFKSAQDLTVSGSGPSALKTFANAVGTIFLKNTSTATTSELTYLKEALNSSGDDTYALTQIASISKTYQDVAAGLAALPVPQELASADLALINATERIGEITSDFTNVDTDPLTTMIALQQYPQAVLDFSHALLSIHTTYVDAGITFPANSPAASFVNLVSNATTTPQQTQSTTP
ncbi:MAG: hypothetical protein B7X04_02650 [Parcubacteria group bacterium 21-54-25]|nr:MAG: hypothetical protein B7X04_02650 [Parcubacteria group bacterium 21-54-25]HQU07748.1 hypothetical protein [Candidatus Paceibacterota bacterium]